MPQSMTRRARRAALGVLAWAAAGTVAASPATDLYRAGSVQVLRSYYGWSTADLPALVGKYEGVLDERCAPQADACPYATGRDVLSQMLREVGDAHTTVRDADAARRLDEIMRDLSVPRTGVRVVRVEGGLLVTVVRPGSPADAAGLRPGDVLTAVNGQPAGRDGAVDRPVGPAEFAKLEREWQAVTVTLRRAGQPERSVSVGTAPLPARDAPTVSWAGADGRVAVVSVPSFLPPDTAELFLARVQEAQAAGARALVVDLRFNGGGGLAECVAAASVFAPVTYRMQFRGGTQEVFGVAGETPRRPPRPGTRPAGPAVWTRPAAVLVGPDTASCAEVFAYYAQRSGVPAVGEATRGVANSGVTFDPLPDGGVLTVTVLRAFTAPGRPLPERVTPDVAAPLDVPALSATGRDTTLEAALLALRPPRPADVSRPDDAPAGTPP